MKLMCRIFDHHWQFKVGYTRPRCKRCGAENLTIDKMLGRPTVKIVNGYNKGVEILRGTEE